MLDANALLALLVDVANARYDGHLTVLKFTTNWRVGLGTITSREDIAAMAEGRTLSVAILNALKKEVDDEGQR